MPQIKITITDEEYDLLKKQAKEEYRSISNQARIILHKHLCRPATTTPPALSYPPGVKGIPEHPYQVTATAGLSQPVFTETTTTYYPDEKTIKIKPKSERNKYCTVSDHPTGNRTADGHKKHPSTWIRENVASETDKTMDTFNVFKQFYPEVTIEEFDRYQTERQNKYKPDPNDPFDPTIGNPYLRNK